VKDDSAARTPSHENAIKSDWMKLIRSYTVEERRQQPTVPTLHGRRRDDIAERPSAKSSG